MKMCFITDISTRDVFGLDFVNYYSQNNKVSVITFSNYDITKLISSINVYRYMINKQKFFKVLRQIKKLLKIIKPDVLISMNCGYHAGISALSGYHPFIWFSYGSDVSYNAYLSRYKKYIISYILHKADMILAQDKVMGDRIKDFVGDNKKIFVKHWGVNTKFFYKKDITKKYDLVNIHGYNKYFYRYVAIYLKAVHLLKSKGLDFKPLLIGNDGYYTPLIKSLGLDDFLIQKKYLSPIDFRTVLWETKILVDPMYPPYNDGCGFGIATIETMCCGTPVILADRECVLLDGKDKWFYGLTFKHCNPDNLADEIQYLVYDGIHRQVISELNHGSVEKNFDRNINRGIILDEIKKHCK